MWKRIMHVLYQNTSISISFSIDQLLPVVMSVSDPDSLNPDSIRIQTKVFFWQSLENLQLEL